MLTRDIDVKKLPQQEKTLIDQTTMHVVVDNLPPISVLKQAVQPTLILVEDHAMVLMRASDALLVSLLLDRADGELARQTGRSSLGGYRYDLVCDCIGNIVAFIGLGIGLRAAMGPLAVLLGR